MFLRFDSLGGKRSVKDIFFCDILSIRIVGGSFFCGTIFSSKNESLSITVLVEFG
jgi:hypothetical protein